MTIITDPIYDWCKDVLNTLTWRIADENSTFSLGDYPEGLGTIKVLNVKNSGRPYFIHVYNETTDKIEKTMQIAKHVTYSINVFGKDAVNKAEDLRNSVFFTSSNDIFFINKLGFIRTSDVRNLTNVISSEFEERGQFDVEFYLQIAYNKEIERIVSVPIKGDIDNGRVIIDRTIS